MNKKIKIIELLNKIANGEDIPTRIKWGTVNYILQQDDIDGHFYYEKEHACASLVAELKTMKDLKSEVELIQDEIDIQSIEKIVYYRTSEDDLYNDNFEDFRGVINELVEAVKQLDRKSK